MRTLSSLLSSGAKLKCVSTIALLVLLLSFNVALPRVHASGGPTVVQSNGADYGYGVLPISTSETVAFSSPVASGDVLVVVISNLAAQEGIINVTDTLGSSFSAAGSAECTSYSDGCVTIYYATSTSSGADNVTLNVNSGYPEYNDIFIFEASGISTTGVTYVVGTSGSSTSSSMSTAPATFFNEGGLLISVGETSNVDTFSAGSGFTLESQPSGDRYTIVEYSTSGVSSPTTFPMAISSGADSWVYAGIAFNPASTGSTSPPPPSVAGNVTILLPDATPNFGLTASAGNWIVDFSASASTSVASWTGQAIAQDGYSSSGSYVYLGYYQGTIGVVSGCSPGMTISITVSYGNSSQTDSVACPELGHTIYANFTLT